MAHALPALLLGLVFGFLLIVGLGRGYDPQVTASSEWSGCVLLLLHAAFFAGLFVLWLWNDAMTQNGMVALVGIAAGVFIALWARERH